MPTTIYMNKQFARWAKENSLSNDLLANAIKEIEQGLVEAALGGMLFKKRIGLQGRGKSGGARTIIALKIEHRAIFLYGFEKNQQDNINSKDLAYLRVASKKLMSMSDNEIEQQVKFGNLKRVTS
jgi:hypothetical protein